MLNPIEAQKNNFDFLRILFAIFVLITHSYPLSGVAECDIMCQLSNGKISFSLIGVKGFFVISGYLILQSLLRSKTIFSYFWKRVLRVFPALLVVHIITVFAASLVYEGANNYWLNKTTLTYIPNNVALYFEQLNIDGIFLSNPYKNTVNGSLWTIKYEVTLYILLSFLYFFRKKVKLLQMIIVALFIVGLFAYHFFIDKLNKIEGVINLGSLLDFGIYFGAGAALQILGIEKIKNKSLVFLLSFGLLYCNFVFFNDDILFFIIFPLVIILIGLQPIKYISGIGLRIGDWSYGTYIYGFFVQQLLMYYFKFNYWQVMISSIPISCLLGFLSWHLIEKRALRLKSKL